MRNLYTYLLWMCVVPWECGSVQNIECTEMEAIGMARALNIDTNRSNWWAGLYGALHDKGFGGELRIHMSDYDVIVGGEEDMFELDADDEDLGYCNDDDMDNYEGDYMEICLDEEDGI